MTPRPKERARVTVELTRAEAEYALETGTLDLNARDKLNRAALNAPAPQEDEIERLSVEDHPFAALKAEMEEADRCLDAICAALPGAEGEDRTLDELVVAMIARASRYEKALREIADHEATGHWAASDFEAAYREVCGMARAALSEEGPR